MRDGAEEGKLLRFSDWHVVHLDHVVDARALLAGIVGTGAFFERVGVDERGAVQRGNAIWHRSGEF